MARRAGAAAAVAALARRKTMVRLVRAFSGRADTAGSTTTSRPRQIDEDLALLAKITNCVRIYSTDDGLDDRGQRGRTG